MKILLVSPRGFCAGVNMAIEALERAIAMFGTPLYVFHEIVHNRHVVERFRGKGVVFVDDVHEVPAGSHLMYSAHGISPAVHQAGRRARAAGHRRHVPAGAQGASRGGPLRPAGLFDRAGRAPRPRRGRRHDGRSARADHAGRDGRGRRPPASGRSGQGGLPDANHAQRRRSQPDDRPLAPAVSALRRLAEGRHLLCHAEPPGGAQGRRRRRPTWCWSSAARTARTAFAWPKWPAEFGRPTYLVDSVAEIDRRWFRGDETVLITAGASAPEELVEECIDYLSRTFGATLEHLAVREEHVEFPLPPEVRRPLGGSKTAAYR